MSKLIKDKTQPEIERDRRYRREHYYRNRQHYLDKQRIINAKSKLAARLMAQKYLKPCIICGEDEPSCIDFHHIEPSSKDYSISYMVRLRLKPDVVEREIQKCVCICANCHRKLHAGKLALPAGIEPALQGFGDPEATMA